MNDTATGFPGFAPGEHRQLLADVSRWARTNKWNTHRDTGWQNPSRLTQVDWDERGLHIGSRNSVDHVWKTPRHWPATSVRQAVDILALIGLLPLVFSSAYEAGVDSTGGVVEAARAWSGAWDRESTEQALNDAIVAYDIDAAEVTR